MTMSVDRSLQRAYAMGVRNREILDLLGQHCKHAVAEYAGGHGMAEAASGLPIDMRTIRCPYARNPVGAAMNMEWIAVDFYRANCVGCPHRQPVGVPNLATFVAGLDEEAARDAEEYQRRAEAADRRRSERAERRSSTATGETLAAATVLDDLDAVDDEAELEPGVEHDRRDNARRRIVETARQAPEAFSPAVIGQLGELAKVPGQAWVFNAMRHLARAGNADARAILQLAVDALSTSQSHEASHVLVDLRDSLKPNELSLQVVRSLIHLAGTPQLHGLTGAFSRGRVRDPAGLILAIEVAMRAVLHALADMLQIQPGDSDVDAPTATLWLPPGIGRRIKASPAALDRDADRAAAAVAARTVLTTVPGTAGVLGPQLLDALEIPDADDDGLSPTAEVIETLAGLLLEQPDVVIPLLVQAGASGDEERRSHLLDIAERAARDLHQALARSAASAAGSAQPVDVEGDFPHHRLGLVDVGAVVEPLFGFALDRLRGNWGHRVAGDAGRLVHTLVSDHRAALYAEGRGVDTVIGHLITAAEDTRVGSELVPPGPLAALEQLTRDQTRYSVLRELRGALRAMTGGDPTLVLDRIEPLLQMELPRATASTSDAAGQSTGAATTPAPSHEEMAALDLREELIRLLGEIAYDHALTPGVLRRVLPQLTTYMLGEHQSLRAAAIKAWAEASRGGQPLPTTLSDCLPVLLTDSYFVVIVALLDVLPSLLYHPDRIEERHLALVLQWAYAIEPAIRSQRPERMPDVISVLFAVARRFDDPVQTQLLAGALALGGQLSGYDLRRHLDSRWPPALSTSTPFAQLCLKALGDQEIGDDRDDIILTLLLSAWPGAAALNDEEIGSLATRVPPEYPLMAGDQVEVLGRLGRFPAAAALTERLLAAVPPAPTADHARAIATAMHGATQLEAAVAALAAADTGGLGPLSTEIAAAADTAEAAALEMAAELGREDPTRAAMGLPKRPSGPASGMLDALTARVAGVRALAPIAQGPMTQDEADRAAVLCEGAADKLRNAYPAALPTATAYDHYADALEIIACLARADAATRRADAETSTAKLDAAHRRAIVLTEQLPVAEADAPEQAPPDPLTAGIAALADRARTAGVDDTTILARQLLSVGLPLRVIQGLRRRARAHMTSATPTETEQPTPKPLIVCLLSIDDHPLTEHAQVLHRDQLYALTVDVRGAGWPVWADRLELEPISQLTDAELTLPAFDFARPNGLAEDGDYQLTASGALVMRFALAPGRPPTPVRLTGQFTGPSDEPAHSRDRQRAVADVAGHPQVRLRPFDPTRDLFTDYPQVDERLLELFGRLHGRVPDDQLDRFARFLTAIVLAAERIQFNKAYKLGTRVSEAAFHDDLENRLRDDPTLGGRITRRDSRALGFLDLDHDQITAELKVERTSPVTPESCHKYLGQPAQYATGADRRLSILVVLDMSRKQAPPGALENYVWLMQPSAHGLTAPAYPSVVAVLVINANNRVPSGWAGRRIEGAPVGDSS